METISDVKLTKFEIMLKETCNWIYSNPARSSVSSSSISSSSISGIIASIAIASPFRREFARLPFYLPISNKNKIDTYLENMYFSKVYDICFLNNRSKLGPQGRDLAVRIKEIRENDEILIEDPDPESIGMLNISGYKIRGGIVFWALVLAAIDEEFYENEISMIADLAYLLKFNEAMIADWIKAVKYLLDGNMFSETMDIDFKTKEANLFFKHIGKKDSHGV